MSRASRYPAFICVLAALGLLAQTAIAFPGEVGADSRLGYVDTRDGTLNLREGPGPGSAIIAELYRGTPVRVFMVEGDWYLVDALQWGDVFHGYVHGDFLRFLPWVTDVSTSPGGSISLYGKFPEGAPVLLLGVDGTARTGTTGEAFIDKDPVFPFDWTPVAVAEPTGELVAAIVGDHGRDLAFAYAAVPFTSSDEEQRARISEVIRDARCQYLHNEGYASCSEYRNDLEQGVAELEDGSMVLAFKPVCPDGWDRGQAWGALAVSADGLLTILSAGMNIHDIHVFTIDGGAYLKYTVNGCGNGMRATYIQYFSAGVPVACSVIDTGM